jgi:signal transduction histidine kinase
MPNEASERLRVNIDTIMNLWQERAEKEVFAALDQKELALRDSLPEYLTQLVTALSTTIDRTAARVKRDLRESERLGKKHGRERAGSRNYTIDQLIFEYHILRQVICDVMEAEAPLTSIQMEIITCSIEQAVNDAATEFSDTLRDIQGNLTATLAHDLRNPLTSAKLYAQLLLGRPDDHEYVVKAGSRIVNAMNRLDFMIHNLLDVSRLRAGEGVPLQLGLCDLDQIASLAADELNDLSGRQVILESAGPVTGYWSEEGLRRVIVNLATNAIKYGAPDTPITIGVTQSSHSATLVVNNEGDPIPEEMQSILFQQYRRTRSAEEQLGWGVGLAVVKGITEALQGEVRVESAENRGTTFVVELPKNLEMEPPTEGQTAVA